MLLKDRALADDVEVLPWSNLSPGEFSNVKEELLASGILHHEDDELSAPYRLTDEGREALAEMIRFADEFSS